MNAMIHEKNGMVPLEIVTPVSIGFAPFVLSNERLGIGLYKSIRKISI
jgi:hypothetical protein